MKIYTLPVGVFTTNCYLLVSETGGCAIIDPGANGSMIARILRQKELTPKMILLTHGHFDHIEAVDTLREEFGLPVYISEADYEMIGDVVKNSSLMIGEGFTAAADHLVHDGDMITLDELTLTVIATPGHTKGSVCYACGSALFTGDTLFAGSVGRTDLYGGDMMTLMESVAALAARPGNPTVLPGHGPTSTMEAERRGNPYLR